MKMIRNIFLCLIVITVIFIYGMAIYLELHPDDSVTLEQRADSLWVLRLKR